MAKSDPDSTDPLVSMMALFRESMDRQSSALESLFSQRESSPEMLALVDTLKDNLQHMQAAQKQGADAMMAEMHRQKRPENQVSTGRSVYNLRGNLLNDENIPEDQRYAKPLLKCRMAIPFELDNDSITREEAELANLLEKGSYSIRLMDDTVVRDYEIRVSMNAEGDAPSSLLGTHPTLFGVEYFKRVPPLRQFLRQILAQKPHTNAAMALVMTMEEEKALIKAGELSVSR